MKPMLFGLTVVVAFTLAGEVLAQPGRKGKQGAARNGWLSSYREGKDLARKTGKPLMVVLRCIP